jgi:2'-5' RNA ligase
MLRLFIAIPLGQQAEQHLGSIIGDLRDRGGGVKWVNPKNIHLTVRFLGDTREELVPTIGALLDKVVADLQTVASSIDTLGAFPNLHRPRVIWTGLSGGLEELSKLAGQIELGVRELGFEAETKGFKPHLTLGRVKDHRKLGELGDYLTTCRIKPKALLLDRVVLFKSTLTPQGPIYERLHESKLGVERFGD